MWLKLSYLLIGITKNGTWWDKLFGCFGGSFELGSRIWNNNKNHVWFYFSFCFLGFKENWGTWCFRNILHWKSWWHALESACWDPRFRFKRSIGGVVSTKYSAFAQQVGNHLESRSNKRFKEKKCDMKASDCQISMKVEKLTFLLLKLDQHC